MEQNSSRIICYDLLRVISIFSMIMLHVASNFWITLDDSSFGWKIANIYDSFARFCVPIFVMISGVFFLDKNKYINIEIIFKKYIKRIIIAFVFWSIIYTIYSNIISYNENVDIFNLKNLLISLLRGEYHLWFLYMIVGIYLIVPFLRIIASNKSDLEYFIILWLIFCVIVSNLKYINAIGEYVAVFENRINLWFVIGYSGYFMLGYYIHNYNISKIMKFAILLLGCISLVLTIAILSYGGKSYIFCLEYLMPNTMLYSVSIFIFFKDYINKIHFGHKSIKTISKLSKYSFGIYLVHLIILNLITLVYQPNELIIGIYIPIVTIIVFVSSLIVISILSRIPILNRYVM